MQHPVAAAAYYDATIAHGWQLVFLAVDNYLLQPPVLRGGWKANVRDESVFNDNTQLSQRTIKSGIAPEDENRFMRGVWCGMRRWA